MSTRSTISLLHLDGKVSSLYAHSSGYLSWNGLLLYEHYRDASKIKELISFGDISSLDKNVSPAPGVKHSFAYESRAPGVTTFYGRDRGETGTEARSYRNIEDYKTNGDFQEYDYIFKEKNSTWYLYNPNNQKFQKLKTALNKEAKTDNGVRDVVERVSLLEGIVKEKEAINNSTPKGQINQVSLTATKKAKI